jgi:ribonuclease Z
MENDPSANTAPPAPGERCSKELRVLLLGTGSPSLSLSRHGIATLIRADGQWLLFDAGRATLQRMYEMAVPAGEVCNLFLTHLHSDHICGLPDLWMTGWFMLHRKRPMQVRGPAGTIRFIQGLRDAFTFDLEIRPRDGLAPSPEGHLFEVAEFGPGTVFKSGAVTVTAFLVDHGPAQPSYGFRIDCGGRRVVLSGDTTWCEGLIEQSTGADLVIQEIAASSGELYLRNAITRRVLAIHTTPEQAADIFTRARPRLAVFNHVNLLGVTEQEVLDRTHAGYDGDVVMGLDRMEIIVGERLSVISPASLAGMPDLIARDFVPAQASPPPTGDQS